MKHSGLLFYSFAIVLFTYSYGFKLQNTYSKSFNRSIVDTSSFTPNQQSGWSTISSYLNLDTPDSLQFELIVKHNNNIDWNTEQLIGQITNDFKPANSQQVSYHLLSNSIWNIRIEQNGQCFLKLTQGIAPADDPAIVPITVRYKKN